MRNKLVDLNNHLFLQLERLNDDELEGEELEKELKRSKAITEIGKVVVNNANVLVEAAKLQYKMTEEPVTPENLLLKMEN